MRKTTEELVFIVAYLVGLYLVTHSAQRERLLERLHDAASDVRFHLGTWDTLMSIRGLPETRGGSER